MKKLTSLASLAILLLIGACSQQNTTAEQALKDGIVKANEEMLNQGNLDYAEEVFTDDYAGQGPGMIKEFVGDLRTAFPDLQVEIDPIIAEGNMTGWRRTHTGTHQGELWGFPPSGKKISWENIIISRYEGGKVAQEWYAGNLREVLRRESGGEQDPAAVIAAVRGAVEALNRGDAKEYMAPMHPGYTQFLPIDPGLSQQPQLGAMEDNFANGMDFNLQLEELDVAFYGSTAIVTGFERGEANFVDGKVLEGKRKYTSVWVNQNGQWKIVHLHISMADG